VGTSTRLRLAVDIQLGWGEGGPWGGLGGGPLVVVALDLLVGEELPATGGPPSAERSSTGQGAGGAEGCTLPGLHPSMRPALPCSQWVV
jgi:hypothetical protein